MTHTNGSERFTLDDAALLSSRRTKGFPAVSTHLRLCANW